MHLGIDAGMNVHAHRITTAEVSDSEGMDAVSPANPPVDKVIADGTYCGIERTETFSRADVTSVPTQKIASQKSEGVIISNLINMWKAFGKPVCAGNG
ncbi:hypothetical protein EOS_35615 [Caballeronia mineralivorans PML1(12)]|uniref:Transposase IS4-like domain-containing protein n=2 Tax=Caballeronia mineralivorans TaxID=2010198 RepID=A0A0J1CM51_9BURK|nr:hypothetical protein EOS_35615 [Caballeronia mineralivorans PML1(12)]